MCLCTKFAKLDNCLISLRTKMKIFCWWTLVHGLLSIPIFGSEVYSGKCHENKYLITYYGICLMLAVIHTYIGILLFLAVQCNLRNEFMFGVVLSNCFPIGASFSYLIYLIVFQIIFITFACRYYSTEMNINQYSLENV
ncbi:uncharacterized protein LOC117781615 isoform X3 [Drosophila innubila]|uniref:uncharacterized protein LOC117781615 isoform X3 n=1 Tax=Drosophila innubila TaxID=198719 RepID=UPI00148D4621|nr:uncharacterized protein LOC117781615 isoform X3 [Drosophila innubila]